MGIPKSQAPKIHLSIRLHRLWRLWSSEVGRDDGVRRPVDDNLVPTAGHTHTQKQGGGEIEGDKKPKAKQKERKIATTRQSCAHDGNHDHGHVLSSSTSVPWDDCFGVRGSSW